jgi:hydroxymethylpyrimidine/phosphomethylpyrimidine kinase
MTRKPPRILSIAGSDSGGGAGIQADIRTISRLGGHAMTAITAVTAQNSAGVRAIDVMTPEMVADQIWAVADDLGIDAIKIGMLGSADNAAEVAGILSILPKVPVVFDPVMVATSGAELADDRTIAIFRRIIPLATLVTPNLPELERLGGEDALQAIGTPFLVKGGHGQGNMLIDRLVGPKRQLAHWEAERIDTRHTHGTGCTLSASIATHLARGDSLKDAIGKARDYVRASLEAAPGYGSGSGPMGVPEL